MSESISEDMSNPKTFARHLLDLDHSMQCIFSAEAAAAANLSWSFSKGLDSDSMAKIVSDLKVNIDQRLKDHPESLQLKRQPKSYLDTAKLLLLIFGSLIDIQLFPDSVPVVDINAPILHGLYPLHLGVLLTSSPYLILSLITEYKAKVDVKCEDTSSPLYGLTPLEMGLCMMSQLIPWTPQLSLHHCLSIFVEVNQKCLLHNIMTLAGKSSNVRQLLFKYAHQGKVIELAALLYVITFFDPIIPTIYIPTTCLPRDHLVQAPVMLRLYVCGIISSLVKKLFHLPGKEGENCNKIMSQMTTVMKILESVHRGDLADFQKEQPLTVEDSCGIPKDSQDESWVNRYLNTSFFYIEPSLFQPRGIFNSLMPLGYNDRLHSYDGFDIRSARDLTEMILRELNGRKIEEVGYQDVPLLRFNLARFLWAKFEEEKTNM